MKNVIHGDYDREDWYGTVTLDGVTLKPAASLKLVNHSPDGFAWGYAGSGPAQLALAILLAAKVPSGLAVKLHQRFKWSYLVTLAHDAPFTLEVDVLEWAENTVRLAKATDDDTFSVG